MRKAVLAVALAALAAACGSRQTPAPFAAHPKLIVLGFDGMDPTLSARWMAAGLLPNFSRVAAMGTFEPLGTTVSPESPTAWASFATGTNAGKHNIYDFLIRDTKTYLPDLGMVHHELPKFLFNYIPISRPKVTSLRGATSFWVTAGKAGVRSDVLTVPITFPPEEVPNGEMLSGLPTPDIRGTMGTFSYYATDVSRYEEGNTEFGGILKRLVVTDGVAHTVLVGPPNPIVRAKMDAIRNKGPISDADRTTLAELEAQEDVTLPLTIRWTRGSGHADIDLNGDVITLQTGGWSPWEPADFDINLFMHVHGMLQFFLKDANDELQLYASPVNFRPDEPPTPISYPAGFSKDLVDELGLYRTLGWAEATWPLNENRIDEKTFMDDLYRAFDDRARVILDRMRHGQWDLLVGVIESTDRVQHMMFRLIDPTNPMYDAALAAKYGDSILRVYQRCDALVGEVLAEMPKDATLVIVSDHGFHSWRKAVNLNTWLVQEGYMVLNGETAGAKNLNDLFGGAGEFWTNVDWSRTRAYAMGLGQIYFNLRGRESQGIVSPGAEYQALADELSNKLKTDLIDPDTGAHIVRNVYERDRVYTGDYLNNAPDLQVGMDDGYRVSWQTTLGGAPPGIVYANTQKWSGDHGGFDYQITSGVLFSSRPIAETTPSIKDIAPTVLRFFGVAVPTDLDGRALHFKR